VITRVGEGETITARERRDVILLADHEEISITRSRYGPGERGPDPHVHREHTDSFYVLEGELRFEVGPGLEPVQVGPGGFVAAPPNVVHTFVNDGDVDARFLNFHTPDGGFAASLRGRRDGNEVAWDSFDPPPDGGRPASEAVATGPGEGERLVTGTRMVWLKAVLPHLCFAEWALDRSFEGPPVHRHDRQVDSFYVLDGELELTVDDRVVTAEPGTLAAVPRGVRHTFTHAAPGTGRVLNVHAPEGGFADVLRRMAG
jgi:quercetin dioxygenase-like cupin family protein